MPDVATSDVFKAKTLGTDEQRIWGEVQAGSPGLLLEVMLRRHRVLDPTDGFAGPQSSQRMPRS